MLTENEKFAEGITDATIEAVAGEGVDEVTRVSLLQGAAIVTLLAEIADKLHRRAPEWSEFEEANRELDASSRSVSYGPVDADGVMFFEPIDSEFSQEILSEIFEPSDSEDD